MCALTFTFAILGITVLLTIAFALFDCLSSSDEDEEEQQSKEEVFHKTTRLVRPQCLALEEVVRVSVKKQHASDQETKQEAVVSDIMRQYAVEFVEDASVVMPKHLTWSFVLSGSLSQAQDATTDMKVLLLGSEGVALKWLCPLFQSTASNVIFNGAAFSGVVLEIMCHSESCTESTAFNLQGMVVVLLGVNSLIWSVFSFLASQPIAQHLRKHQIYSHVAVYMWLLPFMWLLLACSCCYSHKYYDTSGMGRLKHYVYPILIILWNQQIWRSLVAFLYGIGQALSVLLLFFSFVLGISAIVMLFLQGLYTSGDFYLDNQFSDYMQAFTTMFYYVLSGERLQMKHERIPNQWLLCDRRELRGCQQYRIPNQWVVLRDLYAFDLHRLFLHRFVLCRSIRR